MISEHFAFGLETIDHGIQAELTLNRIHKGGFARTVRRTHPPYAVYSVTVDGNTEEMTFSHEDIVDSHSSLKPEAKAKIKSMIFKVTHLPHS